MRDCAWIGNSVEYPDVPEWMRVSEYYGRGYREIEREENKTQSYRDNAAFFLVNPDECVDRRWTEWECKYVIENYGILSIEEMMEYLDRSRDAICAKALRKGVRSREMWTSAETDYVLKHYAESTSSDIAKVLAGRSPIAIRQKAFTMGIKRGAA